MQIGQKGMNVFAAHMQMRNVTLSQIALSEAKCRTEIVTLSAGATWHCTELRCAELRMPSCSKLARKRKRQMHDMCETPQN